MNKPRIMQAIYRWRVRAGLLAALAVLVLARPDLRSLIGGFLAASLGLGLRTWAGCHLNKEKELTITGPYRYTRNPLYLGNLMIGIGMVISSRSWWALALLVVYFLLFYTVAIHLEQKRMAGLFPEIHAEYSRKVPLFFPFRKPETAPGDKNSCLKLYRRNREYRALNGTVLYWMALFVKLLIFG